MAAEGEPVLIEIDGLTKRFGGFTAVDDVSFSVGRGEVLGFLGPNGAGKSTTMRMLAGFMIPTAAPRAICGHDVQTDGVAARRCSGLPARRRADLSGDVGQRLPALLRPGARVMAARNWHDRVDHAVALTRCEGVRLQPVETLSKGFKRRVGLAQALLHDPPVLVLDEPTDGLDPNQKHEVRGSDRADGAGQGDRHLHAYPGGGRRGVLPRDHHRRRTHRGRRDAGGTERQASVRQAGRRVPALTMEAA